MPPKTSTKFSLPIPFTTQYHPRRGQQGDQPQIHNEDLDLSAKEDTSIKEYIRKRLIVCCDGTGESSSNGINAAPTNITRLARAIDTSHQSRLTGTPTTEVPQIVLYQTGVATEEVSIIGSMIAGVFGYGVDRHILEAYTFFSLNHEEGDELFLFGFSRGAFTARAIASLICNVGLLTKEYLDKLPMIYARYKQRVDTEESRKDLEEWVKQRAESEDGSRKNNQPIFMDGQKFKIYRNVEITAMGLFDTVGSLGIPDGTMSTLLKPLSWLGVKIKKYQYHDTSFPVATVHFRAHIRGVYQVLALDECRTSFTPTLLYDRNTEFEGATHRFFQVWMPGAHSDVGGGYERAFHDISDLSFAWMYNNLKDDLYFRPGIANELRRSSLNPTAERPSEHLPQDLGWGLSQEHDEYHKFEFKFGGQRYRTPGQYYLAQCFEQETVFRTSEWIHPSVRVRMLKTGWRPPALDGFTLEREELEEGATRYYWAKECEVPGKGKVRIRLDEWHIDLLGQTEDEIQRSDVDMEQFLVDDVAKTVINDPTCDQKLGKIVGKKSGWWEWLLAF